MSLDTDWVEDVRRWYFGGSPPAGDGTSFSEAASADETALGYEAAHPALQSRHWPDAPRSAGAPLSHLSPPRQA